MEVVLKLLTLILFLGCVRTSVLPVQPCKLDDSSCMTAAFQKAVPEFSEGIPDMGIDVLDPMEMDDLAFDLSGLQFTLKEGRMKGLKGAIIDKITWDSKKKKIQLDFHLNGTVKGHYTAAGRLLILPITGDGQMKLKLRNLSVKMIIDYKMEKAEDGKDRVTPTKLDFGFDIKDNAHFNLTNLFNGNKELSDAMLIFLNENWKQVSIEFGRPMMEAAANSLYKNIAKFFAQQPIEDIAIV